MVSSEVVRKMARRDDFRDVGLVRSVPPLVVSLTNALFFLSSSFVLLSCPPVVPSASEKPDHVGRGRPFHLSCIDVSESGIFLR